MQEVFEGLRKLTEVHSGDKLDDELSVSLDGMDLECLSAACLLHSIGLYTGKKGYHKQSYRVIVVWGTLHNFISSHNNDLLFIELILMTVISKSY